MGITFSLVIVLGLVVIAMAGAAVNLSFVFGVIIPYVAVFTFILGMLYRMMVWARSPVPFRIPSTGGQMKSLPWIKRAPLDNPSNTVETIGRMALEILLFRSLFRNKSLDYREDGPAVRYDSAKWLWGAALLFHYSFLVIFIRHLRFFTEPIPFFVKIFDSLDGMMQVGIPGMYLTDVVIVLALAFLLLRRVFDVKVKYISLPQDYFPLFLILTIAITGILMRYFTKTDITAVKELTMGLVTFQPSVPASVGTIFYVHVFLVSVLFIYFPFSKLVHLGGVFLSPTRNLPNDSRFKRHVNPWNYPVKVHTYDEYEEEFREKMIEAGLPVEKE